MSKITTFLTFESGAEDAVKHYTSIFKNSKIGKTTYYGAPPKNGPDDMPPKGTVMTVDFELEGTPYVALNGGPHFKFTDAVSLSVSVDTQEEVDRLTEQLTAGGGEEGPCGWVKDRWGLSWQITPKILIELTTDKDPVKAKKAMEAMMKMKRIDIAELKRAVGL
jgi:predicted 3-demethylubiquinone-9 3-methyltransferase (glyoxalase superfamily)